MGRWGTQWLGIIVLAAACTPGMHPPSHPEAEFEGPIRSRDVGEGASIYIDLCSACHRGRVNARGYRWTPAQMRHQIRRGNHVMPPLPVELVSDEEVESVLAYLVVSGALQGELPPAPRPPHPAEARAASHDEDDDSSGADDAADGHGGDAAVDDGTGPAEAADASRPDHPAGETEPRDAATGTATDGGESGSGLDSPL